MSGMRWDPKQKRVVIFVNGKWFPPSPEDEEAEKQSQKAKDELDAYNRAKRHVQTM